MNQTFDYFFPSEVRADPSPLPAGPGIYVICSNSDWLANEAGKSTLVRCNMPAGYQPLYVGKAESLRRRLRSHVGNSSLASSFRGSLGAILAKRLGLTPLASDLGASLWFQEENVLSDWIDRHCLIGTREHPDPPSAEKALIIGERPPLNISHIKATKTARSLIGLRQALRFEARRARASQLGG